MKRLASLFLFCCVQVYLFAHIEKQITLSVHYDEADNYQKTSHRVPIAPITVQEEGHLFIFNTCFSGNIIEIYEDDALIYTSYISEIGCVEIPDEICGEFEIRLLSGKRIYSAMVEL